MSSKKTVTKLKLTPEEVETINTKLTEQHNEWKEGFAERMSSFAAIDVPDGAVEYNALKDKYRAVVDKRYSMWFDTAAQASQCYKLALVNKTFWALAFPEYIK